MKGINIISKTPIMQESDLTIIVVTVVVVAALIFTIVTDSTDTSIKTTIISLLLSIALVGALIFMIIPLPINRVETGRYKYKCTIDSNVSYTELINKYEVISHEGNIWVLEDKIAQ